METINYLEAIKFRKELSKTFKQNSKYGFDMTIDDFIYRVCHLNPQKYGLRIQAYFANVMGYKFLDKSLDNGDFENLEGETVEFKCSFLNLDHETNKINIKQIRLYQEIKYYYIFTINFNDEHNLTYKTYKLNKNDMLSECKLMASNCHMTKLRNEENKNVELGITITAKEENEHFKRWEDKYLLTNFNIKTVCDNYIERHKQIEIYQDFIKEITNKI